MKRARGMHIQSLSFLRLCAVMRNRIVSLCLKSCLFAMVKSLEAPAFDHLYLRNWIGTLDPFEIYRIGWASLSYSLQPQSLMNSAALRFASLRPFICSFICSRVMSFKWIRCFHIISTHCINSLVTMAKKKSRRFSLCFSFIFQLPVKINQRIREI